MTDQPMDNPTPEAVGELVEVTQAARQAAHDHWLSTGLPNADTLVGARDSSLGVQAFARLERATIEACAMVAINHPTGCYGTCKEIAASIRAALERPHSKEQG